MAERYGPPTLKALRKMRRRAVNDFYAQDARFWVGKIKSADRMQYDQPVNRDAVEELHTKVLLAPTNQGKIVL